MRWPYAVGAAVVIIAGIALQLSAYDKSWLTAQQPRHCIVWGFGACESIMASGYASIVPGQSVNFEAVVARFVPLAMWLALFVALIALARPTKWLAVGALVVAMLLSAPAFRRQPRAQAVPMPASAVADRDQLLGTPCEQVADCRGLGCLAFNVQGELVPRGTPGATLRCSRECTPPCPAGFRCTSTLVPVSGAAPVKLEACGPSPTASP